MNRQPGHVKRDTSPSSAAGSPGWRPRSSCADRGAGGDALRGALAARRRDVLVRAQRALARQRPARRAPLLHRLPRLPAPHRLGRAAAAAIDGCDVPVLREGQRARARSRAARLPAPLHLAPTLLRYAPLSARERVRRRSGGARAQAARPGRPRTRRGRRFGDWLRAHGQSPNAIDGALEPDRAADAQPARRRGVARGRGQGLPHRPARRGRRLRHRHPRRAVPAAARRPGRRPRSRRAGGRVLALERAVRPARADAGRRCLRRRPGDPRTSRTHAAAEFVPGRRRREALAASARARSSTCTSTTTGRCSTSRWRRRSARPCSWSSTAPPPPGATRGSWSRSRSRTPSTRSASRSPSCASATCRRSSACCRRRAARPCSTSR